MNVSEFLEALMRRFPDPDHLRQISAWEGEYRSRLGRLPPAQLKATFDATLAAWIRRHPPKPGDFKLARSLDPEDAWRHPLCLTSEELFGKPMGNGANVPDLSADEIAEWRRQNGELFLRRLTHWKRMGSTHGAARELKDARDEDAIDAVWADFRSRRDRETPMPYPREPAGAALAHARAYDHAMAEGKPWPPAPAVASYPPSAAETGTVDFQDAPPSPPAAPGAHGEGVGGLSRDAG